MVDVLVNIAAEFWTVLSEMSPYLLFGFLVAGTLSVLIPAEMVQRQLGGRGMMSVIKAAAFGVPLPLCSCGVIPVASSLRLHGASRGATTAFLISTPQTGVDSIFVTYSLLGGVFAIFRPLAALVSGIVGGSMVDLLDKERKDGPTPAPRRRASPAQAKGGRIRRILEYGFLTLPQDIGKGLLVGLVLAGLISVLIPRNYFADIPGGGVSQMLMMLALGIPVYVCATASVPIAAAMVLHGGISPGAALVFLMTGPATNAATIVTVWKVMGRRTAIIYLASVALTALAAGVTMNAFFDATGISAQPAGHWMLPRYVQWASAAALLGVLGVAIFRPSRKEPPMTAEDKALRTSRVRIGGMTCSHCAESVRLALSECPGVERAQVNLSGGTASVRGTSFDERSLRQAVEALGYTVNESIDDVKENDLQETPHAQ